MNGKEIWKPVIGYEGYYEVSNLGRVKSVDRYVTNSRNPLFTVLRKGKILSQKINKGGYLEVNLSKENVTKSVYVHRIVCQAFLSNPHNFSDVDHINTIKTDNRVENLRWVNRKGNMNNPLTREKCLKNNMIRGYKVVCTDMDGNIEKIYQSTKEAGRDGFQQVMVWKCCHNLSKYHKQHKFYFL